MPLRTGCEQPHACPPPVRLAVLRQVPYFAGLDDAELADVDARMDSFAWAAGDALYTQGEPGAHLYVLASGRVKTFVTGPDGAEVVTELLVPGRLFGGLAGLGAPEHSDTAEALTTACALRIGQAAFREVLTRHPAVALRVLDDVAARLARARSREGTTGTVAQRVATTLLRLADELGQERAAGGTLLQVPLTRADLAGLTGSTPESVSRVISRWRREGLVEAGRRWIGVLDRPVLERVAAGDRTD